MAIEFKIREYIKQHGYISCDKLMQEILHLNPSSYYQHQENLGVNGDFMTAPEISQLFGEIIGLWCIEQWQKLGYPAQINLVELGPGRGLLMHDLLSTAKLVPTFYNALTIELIEINNNFIHQQKLNLQNVQRPIHHHSSIEDVQKIPTIFIANEFFDAMPIKQYIKINELWYECVFILDQLDDRIKYDQIPLSKQIQEYFLETHDNAGDQAIFEESYESIKMIEFISNHLKNFSGSCLIIDYGYDISPEYRTKYQYISTLQAIKNHQYYPLLEDLGAADLSAHVDFHALKIVAKDKLLNIKDTTSQRNFLLKYGILLRSENLCAKISRATATIIGKQVDRLISPNQMGTLFKVLQINKFN